MSSDTLPKYPLDSLFWNTIKTVMDKLAAFCGLVVLSPLFLFIIYKIRKDGGPAFYGHVRVGKDGKPFKCWKFRSMILNSAEVLEELLKNDPAAREEWERDFKLREDPRITKIGAFLRKSSLDELPQLWNVLKGEMSLVGPRPVIEDERKYYGEKWAEYLSVKPGMTGLWQVSGRNDTTYDERVEMDADYVHNWSLWSDFTIIFKTIFVVLDHRGAY